MDELRAKLKASGRIVERGAEQSDEATVEGLVEMLTSALPYRQRIDAAAALGRIGNDRAMSALAAALHDSYSESEEKWQGTGDYSTHTVETRYPVREAAARALKMMDTPEAKRALEAAPPAVESLGGFAQ